jgi:hypothetical protein
MAGDSSVGQHQPPADRRAWGWRCGTTGEGGGARATLAREADRRDRETMVPDGQRLGAGGSERERGTMAQGANRRAWQHSASRPGFKHSSNRLKQFKRFKRIQNCPNFG